MSAATADVAIIGGGIVGAACARALALEKLRAVLIEAGDVASGATAAGMGHIVAMDDSEAQFALTCYSSKLWAQLRPSLPSTVEYEASGTLWIAADDEEMEAVRAKHSFYTQRGMRAEILDETMLYQVEPKLRAGLAGALLVPSDAVIYAPCAAHWLAEQARERGAWIRQGVEAIGVEPGLVKLNDGSTLSAGAVVVAAGAASMNLIPGLPIRPRKGYLAITDRYPGFLRHQLVELGYLKSAHGHDNESVAFNAQPRSTGQILIGSSRQYDAGPSLLAPMLRRAFEYMPGLADLSVIRTWHGFRAATPDSLPIIGPIDGGPWAATGHEGLGITTSLGTAQLLTDQLLSRPTAIPCEPYLPSRFPA
jgi:glycine/D-amino acid oxidase-like deaminating enzyme